MNDLTSVTDSAILTMSSREISELVEKRHDNVKRTIDTLSKQGVISYPQIEDGEKSANGVIEKIYKIGKRDSFVIVAQLSPEFTARLVDRWQELENRESNPIANLTRIDLIKLALHSEEERLALEEKNKELTADSEALSRIAKSDGSLCITDAAKTLQIRPKDLFQWLRMNKWIYKRIGCAHDCGYQDKINQALLEHKSTTILRSDGSDKITQQVRITPEGLEKLSKLISTDIKKVA